MLPPDIPYRSIFSRESNFADLLEKKNVFEDLNSQIAYLAGPLTIPTMQFAIFIFEDGPKVLEIRKNCFP